MVIIIYQTIRQMSNKKHQVQKPNKNRSRAINNIEKWKSRKYLYIFLLLFKGCTFHARRAFGVFWGNGWQYLCL